MENQANPNSANALDLRDAFMKCLETDLFKMSTFRCRREKPDNLEKKCRSKYRLETKCTYGNIWRISHFYNQRICNSQRNMCCSAPNGTTVEISTNSLKRGFIFITQMGKSILQVPDTGTRVLDNTRPFLCSSIVSFWITPTRSKERKYHIFRQYWYTENVPVFTNTGTFQYLGPEVYFFRRPRGSWVIDQNIVLTVLFWLWLFWSIT